MTGKQIPDRPGLVFAADVGGTHLRVALVDEAGRILTQRKSQTPKDNDARSVVRALVDASRQCDGDRGPDAPAISAASIMIPGTINKNNTMVVQVPNLPCLNSMGLKAILEDELGWPVVLENDANAAAVGEMWLGAARGCRSVIGITLGTGVGGGIILDGKLWRGADGSAGEIGHTTVEPFGELKCKCGNIGCLEMFASATAIVRMVREWSPFYAESTLHVAELSAERVFFAGREGDELALKVFEQVGKYLGVALASLINLLGPEMIVIGGGVANGWELFEKDMRQEVRARVFLPLAERVRIVPAECGDNAGLLGAARLAFDARLTG